MHPRSPGEGQLLTVTDRHVWNTQRIGECLVLGLIPMTPRSSLSMAEFVTLRSLSALGTPRSPLVPSLGLRRTNKEKSPMAVFNGVFPILPGKEQLGRDFAAACVGERRKGFDAELARGEISRETWALQETPMGSFMLVWFEAPDIEKTFTELATSGDEFAIWFRGQVKDVTGVDMAAPPEGPLPDVLVDLTS